VLSVLTFCKCHHFQDAYCFWSFHLLGVLSLVFDQNLFTVKKQYFKQVATNEKRKGKEKKKRKEKTTQAVKATPHIK
jgi:hypothetical protein